MRKIVLSVCIVAMASVLFACSKKAEASHDEMRRYGVKSGIVEYELSGMQNGKETIWFDQWGMREAKLSETTVKVLGFSRSQSQLTLTEGEWVTSVDLQNNSGTRIKNPMFAQIAEGEDRDLRELGEEMMVRMGGKKVGTEKLLGKKCDIWEVAGMGSKTWIWKSIPLKSEVNMAGMKQLIVATRIDEKANIPDDKFQISENISISEAPTQAVPDMSQLMKSFQQGQK